MRGGGRLGLGLRHGEGEGKGAKNGSSIKITERNESLCIIQNYR